MTSASSGLSSIAVSLGRTEPTRCEGIGIMRTFISRGRELAAIAESCRRFRRRRAALGAAGGRGAEVVAAAGALAGEDVEESPPHEGHLTHPAIGLMDACSTKAMTAGLRNAANAARDPM